MSIRQKVRETFTQRVAPGRKMPSTGALSLSFDDTDIDGWHAALPIFERYQANVTFFVTRYGEKVANTPLKSKLLEIQAAGHEIGFHGTNHCRATDFVAERSLERYLADEIKADLTRMRSDGFDVVSMAMPFGATDDRINNALMGIFDGIRGFASGNFARAFADDKQFKPIAAGIDRHVYDWKKVRQAMNRAKRSGRTLYMASHNIRVTCDGDWCIEHGTLDQLLAYAQDIGLRCVTFSQSMA